MKLTKYLWRGAKNVGDSLFKAGTQWVDDDSSTLAAALAYYAIFSIVPLMIIVSTVVAFLYGRASAQQSINMTLDKYFGPATTTLIENALAHTAKNKNQGLWASIMSAGFMIFGASKVFAQLQLALNKIWNVRVEKQEGWAGARTYIKDRLLSFGMVLGLCFILLASLILSTIIEAIGAHMSGMLPGEDIVWKIANIGCSVLVYSALFAALFKFVPDVKLKWRGVWFGAIVTSVLFLIGQWGLSTYLANNSTVSSYGAAGALVSFLIWIYYSAQVAFFGAELTQVTIVKQNWSIQPLEHAQWTHGAILPDGSEEDGEINSDEDVDCRKEKKGVELE